MLGVVFPLYYTTIGQVSGTIQSRYYTTFDVLYAGYRGYVSKC